eukprot:TCONS_00025966-protein
MALFGNSASLGSSKYLVEFRAGKMNMRGTTVTPDKRKGQVYIHQSEDSLMHFCWKDRTTGNVEDDLIIFPDDIEFKRVTQCTTGRVYILKFKSSSRKFFFWLQEPKTDKDEEHCKKVNEMLNNPPAPGSALGGSGGSGGAAGGLAGLQPALASLGDQLGDSNLQNLINNMDQNQLMQLLGMTGLGGAGGLGADTEAKSSSRTSTAKSSTTSATTTSTPAAPTNTTSSSNNASKPTTASSASKAGNGGGAVQLSDLQSILSNMQVPANQESVDLAASFSVDALVPLLADKETQEKLKPFLPAVENLSGTEQEIKETVQSAQFKQALSTFSAALSSGQLAPLMQQFKLSQNAIDAATKGDIVTFVKALQEAESKENKEEDMALD